MDEILTGMMGEIIYKAVPTLQEQSRGRECAKIHVKGKTTQSSQKTAVYDLTHMGCNIWALRPTEGTTTVF